MDIIHKTTQGDFDYDVKGEYPKEGQTVFVLSKEGNLYLCRYSHETRWFGQPKHRFRNIMSKFHTPIEVAKWTPVLIPYSWEIKGRKITQP